MQIKSVSVEYRELRSSGYPSFNNTTFGIQYSADVAPHEFADAVRRELLRKSYKRG